MRNSSLGQHSCLIVLLLCAVCLEGCGSDKVLDESRARSLLRDHIKDTNFAVPATAVMNYMVHTQVDYSVKSALSDGLILSKLLQKGFIVQIPRVVSYPKLSGRFEGRVREQVNQLVFFRCDFVNQGESNKLRGECQKSFETDDGKAIPDAYIQPSTITGSFEENFRFVALLEGPFVPERVQGLYTEEGKNASLRMDSIVRDKDIVITGKRSNERAQLKWFDYSASPTLLREIDREGYFRVGPYGIGELTDLRLETETLAAAKFNWTVKLNDFGRTLLNDTAPKGVGRVIFAKKPDGTWFIDRVSYQ
jgi:hypothetical protein